VASEAEPYWTSPQKEIYTQVKAILDRGEVPTSRLRRALDEVCDQLALSLRADRYAAMRTEIRDLLVAVDTYAVSPAATHLLGPEVPAEVRLHGIIILVSVPDQEKPKEGIVAALADPSPAVRLWAVRGMVAKGYADEGSELIPLLEDDSAEVRLAAAGAVNALKVAGAEASVVSLAEREAVRRVPFTQQVADLESQLKELEDKPDRTQEDDAQLALLRQRLDEACGDLAFVNLIIFRAGQALTTLTNGEDGLALDPALADEELQKVIEDLRRKYPLRTT
jgi:hypothetical protein